MESEPERIGKTRVNTGWYRVHKGGFGSQEMRTEMIRYVNQWRSWKGTGTELGDRLEAARLPWVVSYLLQKLLQPIRRSRILRNSYDKCQDSNVCSSHWLQQQQQHQQQQ
ncbi:unnamed protein product [Nesidiocoris tenuis]|uniref:Uncharacterized protein n=1 Tax=Nesidiocoris tenuis TaxID=355587 RepID=A0A6H5FYZ8_9HEMI|nr:unnamed protein product [Nesidiocoris tenuis]